MKKVGFLFFILIGFFSGQAQVDKVDSFFKSQGKVLNGQVLLSVKEKPVWRMVGGYASFRDSILNKPNSLFNLASISKCFTAVALLQLVEQHKLGLNDPLVTYLPEFPFKDISIKQLLSHTSGLPDIEIYGYQIGINPDTIVRNRDVIPALRNWKPGLLFEPGTSWRYSNPGYSLLALLVEKISGQSFKDYLQKNIFNKAGMRDTYLWQPTGQDFQLASDRVRLHVLNVWYETRWADIDSAGQFRYFIKNCAGTVGEKNVISTTDDLLRFDAALFGGKLLSQSTLDLAFTPIRLKNGNIWKADHMDTMLGDGTASYGLGFELFDQPGFGKSVGHGGFMGGLATFYFHHLASNQTLIAYQNTSDRVFGNLITGAFYLLNGKSPYQEKLQESIARLYGYEMMTKGIDAATVLLNELRYDTLNYYLSELEMNWLGYDMLYFAHFPEHKADALEVHKVNSLLFPKSFNVYDSYAESLLQNGHRGEAIRMYKKSLELNAGNEGGKRALDELLKK